MFWLEQEIQTTLREEIKSACEYRPFEKCDYSAKIANEICCKKLEYVIEKLDTMQHNLEQSTDDVQRAGYTVVSVPFFCNKM